MKKIREYIMDFGTTKTKQLIKQAERAGYIDEQEYLYDQIYSKILKDKKK